MTSAAGRAGSGTTTYDVLAAGCGRTVARRRAPPQPGDHSTHSLRSRPIGDELDFPTRRHQSDIEAGRGLDRSTRSAASDRHQSSAGGVAAATTTVDAARAPGRVDEDGSDTAGMRTLRTSATATAASAPYTVALCRAITRMRFVAVDAEDTRDRGSQCEGAQRKKVTADPAAQVECAILRSCR